MTLFGRIGGLVGDARSQFVVANVAANLLFLFRSVVALWVLDYVQLGLVAMLQTIVMLIGILQFGILNGAYRLICSADDDEARSLNDLVYSFLAVLGVVSVLILLAMVPFTDSWAIIWVALLAAGGGLATVVRNWMTNRLIAAERFHRLNALIFWSAACSVASLALIPIDPLLGCLAPIVVNPVVFLIFAYLAEPDQRPSAFNFSVPLVRRVLGAGFVVFLAGILLQLQLQVERWYVTGVLGIEALGHLSVAVMYITLFQLVPTSLDAIFLPRMVRAHTSAGGRALRMEMRRYLLVVTIYLAAAAVGTFLIMPVLVELLLSKYSSDLIYVYLIFPGLVLMTYAGVLATGFQVHIRMTPLLIAYAGGTLALILALGSSVIWGVPLTLNDVELLRSTALAITAALVIVGYIRLSRADNLREAA